MDDEIIALYYGLFFFAVAFLFWVLSVGVKSPSERVLAFWYAVVFEFAGYAALAIYVVTSRGALR